MWFYSNEFGYVFRTDNFDRKNVTTKLGNYTSPDELVAVVKTVKLYNFIYLNLLCSI